jgi:hypothetical protein
VSEDKIIFDLTLKAYHKHSVEWLESYGKQQVILR